MLLKTDGVAKGFPTSLTNKWSGSAVRSPDMNLQSMRRRENLAALDTVVIVHRRRKSQAVINGVIIVRLWSGRGAAVQTYGSLQHGGVYVGWDLFEAIGRMQGLPGEALLVEGGQGERRVRLYGEQGQGYPWA